MDDVLDDATVDLRSAGICADFDADCVWVGVTGPFRSKRECHEYDPERGRCPFLLSKRS